MTCSGALDEGWSRAETTATWAEIHLLSSPSLAPLAGLSARRFGLTKGCHTLLGRWLFRRVVDVMYYYYYDATLEATLLVCRRYFDCYGCELPTY